MIPRPAVAIDLQQRIVEKLPWLRALLSRLAAGDGELRDQVDDMVQEVCVRALRSRDRFDPEGSLRGWLGKTAFHVYLDQRARRRVLAPVADPTTEGAPEDGAEARDELEVLLRELSAVEREVLLRLHRDGQSVAVIAAALRMPEGTVKSHLHRGRRKLAEAERSRRG